RRRRAAADRVARRLVVQANTTRVAQRYRAGLVGADVVAQDDVARRAQLSDVHADRASVDNVPGGCRGAADRVIRRPAADADAEPPTRDEGCASYVRAEIV